MEKNIIVLHLQESSCLIYIICVCLRIVVSNTYCVVFLFVCLRLIRGNNCLPLSGGWVHLGFLLGFVLLIVLIFYFFVLFAFDLCLVVFTMLPVILDYSFLNTPSVFSDVYLMQLHQDSSKTKSERCKHNGY
jgi:hypothetical protein